MAEAAGLALGVLGVAGLFTSCIENFDIIVRAKDFGEDFDLLCTQLSLQRIRLAVWGETVGLLPSFPDRTRRASYNRAIDRRDIKPSIIASLHQLRNLLTKADVITERYSLECTPSSNEAYEQEITQMPRGMLVMRDSFQKFKERVRNNQKQKSVWKVTRWSIHDYAQFEALVDQVRKLLDGLESITNALGILERQHERLLEEVDSVSDAQSLSLLQEVGSLNSAPASLRAVSETASIRLTILSGDSQSYHTAKTGFTGQSSSNNAIMGFRLRKAASRAPRGEKHITAIHLQNDIAVSSAQVKEQKPISGSSKLDTPHFATKPDLSATNDSTPQHQRWMRALLVSRPDTESTPAFSPDDINYGELIGSFKASDDQAYVEKCGQLLSQANTGLPLAQRVFIELRNIHRAAIPYISAVPVGDALDMVLACIEGPPGTPYQGGIFWITVRIQESSPPAMRFQTRIYHPNIDHAGNICADYAGWWHSAKMLNKKIRTGGSPRDLPWFYDHATNHYSLGALLVALCGLLASPNIEDPLVPEIAEKFVTNYDGYCEAARLYTKRYASAPRPPEEELEFSPDSHVAEETTHYEAPDFNLKVSTALSSIGHMGTENSSRDGAESVVTGRSIRGSLKGEFAISVNREGFMGVVEPDKSSTESIYTVRGTGIRSEKGSEKRTVFTRLFKRDKISGKVSVAKGSS